MVALRLIADDLTGALDSAAAFGSAAMPVPVLWRGEIPRQGGVAFDTATRERPADEARAVLRACLSAVWGGAGLRYKKIDSLLRGHEAEEIDEIVRGLRPRHLIVAPAFPAQRRVTRGGRQLTWSGGTWASVPNDLAARLEACDHAVTLASSGDAVPAGISLWDAETNADLDDVVRAADGLDDVLWVGSGGLAAALARAHGATDIQRKPLAGPILGLFGTDHPVILAQLDKVARLHLRLPDDGGADEVARLLERHGAGFVSVAVPAGTPRSAAAARIERILASLVRQLDPPGTLMVAGGETLRGVCNVLGATHLDITGEVLSGIPRSILRGGPWDGTVVVSKSGAFGTPDLLRDLIAAPAVSPDGATT